MLREWLPVGECSSTRDPSTTTPSCAFWDSETGHAGVGGESARESESCEPFGRFVPGTVLGQRLLGRSLTRDLRSRQLGEFAAYKGEFDPSQRVAREAKDEDDAPCRQE